MILSMTGYGSAQRLEDGFTYSLVIKSVNHRYLKLAIRLPELLQFAENAVEKALRARVARGSVSYTLWVRSDGEAGLATLDIATMQRYVDQMTQVRLPDGTERRIDLSTVASLPGVCQAPEADESAQKQQLEVLEELTAEALAGLLRMRREEGKALGKDLLQICEAIRTQVGQVAVRAPVVVEEYHERLKSRVGALLKAGELELESDGLMREVAIYADRCDISEEVARLVSHLDQFTEFCNRDEQVGRTLDFLTQELLREANTIAAKAGDATIARGVVEIKRLIERLKEQVQNVE